MIFAQKLPSVTPLRAAIRAAHLASEDTTLEALLPEAEFVPTARQRIVDRARRLLELVRDEARTHGGLEAFMHEYDLSTQEGVMLMCLAEALLRIPDSATADRLIRDKLGEAEWDKHLGHSPSLFVNASTWGLMLTGRIVRPGPEPVSDVRSFLKSLIARSGEPVIRKALREAMGIMSHQFVMGQTIDEALARSREGNGHRYRFSFDMLGEAALGTADAERYQQAYYKAIDVLAPEAQGRTVFDAPGISVKLSALHPRFEFAQRDRVIQELVPRVETLAIRARQAGIGITVDAEEAERLELTLDVFEAVFTRSELRDWEGFGLAIQTYQRRAPRVVAWLAELARSQGRRIMLRLTKGAYWDREIKHCQQQGLDDYPVFLHKAATDVCYLACARRALAATDAFYPQFATHNGHTIASIIELAGDNREFEFQRLHGMGEALYAEVTDPAQLNRHCRVYAPVGSHEDLLPYLVRRLLENGSNTSFVNRIVDEDTPIGSLLVDPVEECRRELGKPDQRIPLPGHLYGGERRNSRGIDLSDPAALVPLAAAMDASLARDWEAGPIVGGRTLDGPEHTLYNPAERSEAVGRVREAEPAAIDLALARAAAAAPEWDRTPATQRAECLERAADLLEQHTADLMSICIKEGGRCIPDALGEVREAVDFCRYYAQNARSEFDTPRVLAGATGEQNELGLSGRGVFACISPWNFPVAIFTGQLVAALAAGNAVIAKPAGQTPLAAAHVVRLLHEAGVPSDVLHLLPGKGAVIGARLLNDPNIAGVAFTGSTETAQAINQQLAQRAGPIVPLIAETGGQNAMVVDSSALPEQVVRDVLRSAFNSAGQRCSALRVLFLQDEIAEHVLALLQGTMAELKVGDPIFLSTDIGPVIDVGARETLLKHMSRMRVEAKPVYEVQLPAEAGAGTFVAPCAFEIGSLSQLEREVFGPILHVVRYAANRLDAVIDAINATGYGLTLGIHTRIEATARHIQQRTRAGNTYVNRDMIGAVVGVQPFGGMGLSGTGPKAGGPYYLHRFATERTFTVNTSAMGGNTSLLAPEE